MPDVPEYFAQRIAAITLNWSQADLSVTICLRILYAIDDQGAIQDLLEPLDLRKKLGLVEKLEKRGKIADELSEICSALKYANHHFRPNRNLVAHGVLTEPWEDEGREIFSYRSPSTLPAEALERALEQSRYTATAANYMLQYLATGSKPGKLPARPPK